MVDNDSDSSSSSRGYYESQSNGRLGQSNGRLGQSNGRVGQSFSPTKTSGNGVGGGASRAIYAVIELNDGRVCCGGADGSVRVYDLTKAYQQQHHQQQHQHHQQHQEYQQQYLDGGVVVDAPLVLVGHTDWIR